MSTAGNPGPTGYCVNIANLARKRQDVAKESSVDDLKLGYVKPLRERLATEAGPPGRSNVVERCVKLELCRSAT